MKTKDKVKKTVYQNDLIVTDYLYTRQLACRIKSIKSVISYFLQIREEILYTYMMPIEELPLGDVYELGEVPLTHRPSLTKFLKLLRLLKKTPAIESIEVRKDRQIWVTLLAYSNKKNKEEKEKLIANIILHNSKNWVDITTGQRDLKENNIVTETQEVFEPQRAQDNSVIFTQQTNDI